MNEENMFKADTCIDQLSKMDKSLFDEQQTKAYDNAYKAICKLANELEAWI